MRRSTQTTPCQFQNRHEAPRHRRTRRTLAPQVVHRPRPFEGRSRCPNQTATQVPSTQCRVRVVLQLREQGEQRRRQANRVPGSVLGRVERPFVNLHHQWRGAVAKHRRHPISILHHVDVEAVGRRVLHSHSRCGFHGQTEIWRPPLARGTIPPSTRRKQAAVTALARRENLKSGMCESLTGTQGT